MRLHTVHILRSLSPIPPVATATYRFGSCAHARGSLPVSRKSRRQRLVDTKIPYELQADNNTMAEKQASSNEKENFLRQFRDIRTREFKQINANQFMQVWNHYDQDGNGYIEEEELDGFLKELVTSVNLCDVGPEVMSDTALRDAKQLVLDAFDENHDGRIDIAELAQILPMEQNFLLLFRRDHPLDSSVEFMKTWREYDTDHSGFIEADELKNFLHDLLKQSHKDAEVSEEQLITYADTMLQLFDRNKDGKLQLSEMAKLLPVKENFLCRPIFKGASRLTMDDIDRVFNLYDVDRNGYIENEELHGFLKDLMELVEDDYDADDLLECQKILLEKCDLNQDGKINKEELTMVLTSASKNKCQTEDPDKTPHNTTFNLDPNCLPNIASFRREVSVQIVTV